MPKHKYEGLLLEGRWVFKAINGCRYDFENIFNHNIITLSYKQVNEVLSGKSTIGAIMCRRIGFSDKTIYKNHTTATSNMRKRYFARGGK